MTQKTWRIVAITVGVTLMATTARAADSTPAATAPVATVNGTPITVDAYRIQQSRLPARYFEGNEAAKTRKMLFDELINDALLLDAATRTGVAKTPEYAARVAEFREYLLRELYLSTFLREKVSDDVLRKAYTAQYTNGPQNREIKARHILVKTKAEAEALIAQLHKGASFAELAKSKSTDISKIQGGDLGWFGYDTMVEPFAVAAFALKAGEYTRKPIETTFGWHVIQVEETRPKQVPAFDDVRGQLEQDINLKQIEAHLATLRKQAKITVNKDILSKLEQEKPAVSGSEDADDMGDMDHHGHGH